MTGRPEMAAFGDRRERKKKRERWEANPKATVATESLLGRTRTESLQQGFLLDRCEPDQ